jgi:hypothetical protein
MLTVLLLYDLCYVVASLDRMHCSLLVFWYVTAPCMVVPAYLYPAEEQLHRL